MLFDLEDYVTGGVIGPDAECVTCETWEDMAGTARATRDAWIKSVNEWYNASVCCITDSQCEKAVKNMWEEFLNFYQNYYVNVWEKFWDSLSCDGTFTDEICNTYRKAMIDLKCMVKQLMRLVDGDFIKDGKILYE